MDREQPQRPVVAIINTAQESIELLENVLADAGFTTVAAFFPEFKRGQRNFDAFFQEHHPQVIIWDIALPYIENWHFFEEQVLTRQLLPEHCIVVTTANRTVLDMLVGPTPAHELVGRPLDLQGIIDAVKRAVSSDAA